MRRFDGSTDPGELIDVSDRHPEVVQALLRTLQDRSRPDSLPPAPGQLELDEKLIRELESLGYLDS